MPDPAPKEFADHHNGGEHVDQDVAYARERLARCERTYEPHAYIPQGVPGWRTCDLCGAGANARIHRTNRTTDAP